MLIVLMVVSGFGCGLIRVNGKPVGGSAASSYAGAGGAGAAPVGAGASRGGNSALQAAVDAKDLAGIKKNWTVGYDFNPLRPKVAVALFDLDLETLANLLLANNCFAGCEDLANIDKAYGTDRVVTALKGFLTTHAFAAPGDNIVAQKIGGYLVAHDAFKADVCGAYLKILGEDKMMTYGPLGELGEGRCTVPKKTLVHFLTSDDPEERRLAAWVAGETGAKSVKPLLERLSMSDGAFDSNNLKYPVRDAATTALTKIENR
ncbi:MAG: HEAT repeat domain-containing protein [Myxococcales bacterium]